MSGATVYIVLFRGVGGKTQLPTARLRAALGEAGFENVSTYINSGNAVLRSSLSRAETAKRIAELVDREFGFTKDIHLVTRAEWAKIIAQNPFEGIAKVPKFLHAAVLGGVPEKAKIESIESVAAEGEGFIVIGKVAYLHTPSGLGTSKMAEKFDRTIGVPNTARNWNTVLKLAALADAAQE